jgi:hypothetical protein
MSGFPALRGLNLLAAVFLIIGLVLSPRGF